MNHIRAAQPKLFSAFGAKPDHFLFAAKCRKRGAKKLIDLPHDDRVARPTSKMSHDAGRHAACIATIYVLWFHFDTLSKARGVTDGGVGSGALLGLCSRDDRRHPNPAQSKRAITPPPIE